MGQRDVLFGSDDPHTVSRAIARFGADRFGGVRWAESLAPGRSIGRHVQGAGSMTSHQPDTGRQIQLLNALPHAALLVDEGFNILEANNAAEVFFRTSLAIMRREGLKHFVPFGSPVFHHRPGRVIDGAH
jgi:PAS domain-containing protein